MSRTGAEQFLERVATDVTIGHKLGALGSTTDFEAVRKLAEEEGFQFTGDELIAASKARETAPDGPLTDSDLARVSGGGTLTITVRYGSYYVTIKAVW